MDSEPQTVEEASAVRFLKWLNARHEPSDLPLKRQVWDAAFFAAAAWARTPTLPTGADERGRLAVILTTYAHGARSSSLRERVEASQWAVDAILSGEDPRRWATEAAGDRPPAEREG